MTEARREQLIEAGLRLIEEEGAEALNARRLSKEIGTSTMAVYTNFGGMAGLHEAITVAAIARFGRHLAEAPKTDDPVTDLMAIGLAYRDFAVENPRRYRFMFGVTAPGMAPHTVHELTNDAATTVPQELKAAFGQLIAAVRRVMEAGRIRRDDEVTVAAQIWSMIHGYVLLEISGVFGPDGLGVFHVLAPHAINLLVGLGDDRDAAERSALAAAPDPADLRLPPDPVTVHEFRRGRRVRSR